MAKKRVKIYKSPSGKGEYRNKLSNFLYIAKQGMSVPQQQAPTPGMSYQEILKKNFLKDYISESLEDDYTDTDITFIVQELTQAGHNPQMIDAVVREVIESKQNKISRPSTEFKDDLLESELIAKREEEAAEAAAADAAEEEQILTSAEEDDDAYNLDEESRDKIKRQLFFNEDEEETEETEEVNSKQLGGLVKMKLGGGGDDLIKGVLKGFNYLTDAGVGLGKTFDSFIDEQAAIVASRNPKYQKLGRDELFKNDDFVKTVYGKAGDEISAVVKKVEGFTGGKFKKVIGQGKNLTDDAIAEIQKMSLYNSKTYDDAVSKLTKAKSKWADELATGSVKGRTNEPATKFAKRKPEDIQSNLQSEKITTENPGLAVGADGQIKAISKEGLGDNYDAYIQSLDEDYGKYFTNKKSGVTMGDQMAFRNYTTDGKPIYSIQMSDGNIVNGVLSKSDAGSYSIKPILGVTEDGKAIYSKTAGNIEGDNFVKNFIENPNNQLDNLDDFDKATRVGKHKNIVKDDGSVVSTQGELDPNLMIGQTSVIDNVKDSYVPFSTQYASNPSVSTLGRVRRIAGDITGFNSLYDLTGQVRSLITGNNYSPINTKGLLNTSSDYLLGTEKIMDPRKSNKFYNYFLPGSPNAPGSQQGTFGTFFGKNRGVLDVRPTSDNFTQFAGQTPGSGNYMGAGQNIGLDITGSPTKEWFNRNFLSGRLIGNTFLGSTGTGLMYNALNPSPVDSSFRGATITLNPNYAGETSPYDNINVMQSDTLKTDPNLFKFGLTERDVNRFSGAGEDIYDPDVQFRVARGMGLIDEQGNPIKKQLGGMTKAQFVREGLKDFKRKFKPGGTVESPGSINQEESKREGNKNNLISAVQNNVAIDQKTKELEQQYDMLRNQESNTMNNYNPEGMQYAKLGAISKKDMRRLNRKVKRAGKLFGNIPSNMTKFETSGNIFNRKYSAEFDPTIPNMNPFAYGAGFRNMGPILGNIIGRTINQVPTTFRVPLAQANNQAAITNTNVDKEKVAEANLAMQQNLMYLEVLKNNPPGKDETLEEYKSRVNLGDVEITEEMFNMVKAPSVKDLPGYTNFPGKVNTNVTTTNFPGVPQTNVNATNFPVISGCFGGNCADPNKQEGGFVDSSNPDLYRFVYGGDEDAMYALGGFPTAEEGIIVEGQEGMTPLPVTNLPAPIPLSQEEQTMLEYNPSSNNLPLPTNPYGEASNIIIDRNMGSPAVVEETSPTVVFNQETQMFEEVAPAETPMVTVAPGEGAAPALLDTSKEAIDLAVSQAPVNMNIPEDVKEQGAKAILSFIEAQKKRDIMIKEFQAGVTPNIQGGLADIKGNISGEATIGTVYNPATIKGSVTGGWNNPNYGGSGVRQGFQSGDNIWDVKGELEYITPKTKRGNQWSVKGGLQYGQDQNQKGNLTPTLGVTYINNQMGGEPELPQNFLGGLGRLIGRGYAANPAFGRRMKYSGPQTMAGQTYYGNAGNLVKQEGKRGLFGRTKWTNTYAVPGSATTGPQGAASGSNPGTTTNPAFAKNVQTSFDNAPNVGTGNSIANYDMSFMQNRPDFNAPEEVDDRSRFEKRTDRLINRRERRQDRRDARAERKMDRKSDRYNRRDERKYERDRRKSIRKGFGDPGSYRDEQARIEADYLAQEAHREKELKEIENSVAKGIEPLEFRKAQIMSNSDAPTDIIPLNDVTFTGTTVPQGSRRSDFSEGVLPSMYNMDNFQNRVYGDNADRVMGDDNITFNSTGTGRPTLQNKNPQTFTNQRGAPSNTTRMGLMEQGVNAAMDYYKNNPNPRPTPSNTSQLGLMEQGVNAAQQYFAENPNPTFVTQQPSWAKAYGGAMIGDEVEMTEDEMRMFILGGGVLEYI